MTRIDPQPRLARHRVQQAGVTAGLQWPRGWGAGFEDGAFRIGEIQAPDLFRVTALIDLEHWQRVRAARSRRRAA